MCPSFLYSTYSFKSLTASHDRIWLCSISISLSMPSLVEMKPKSFMLASDWPPIDCPRPSSLMRTLAET